MKRETLIKTALGELSADLLFINAKILNVFTGELLTGQAATAGDTLAYVGEHYPGSALETIDLEGAYLVPGFIDAHCHIESSMVTPPVYCAEALPWGVTTLITDPHEIANVAGGAGLRFMLDSSQNLPLNYYIQLPSCVPATPFEHAGAVFTAEKMEEFLKEPRVLGLGEMMNYPGVASCDPEVMRKLSLFEGGLIDGHAPGISGAGLQAYRAAGMQTDHESTSWEEAREKLRAGFAVLVREGSACKNLEELVQGILRDGVDTRFLAFCTDDKHLSDIRREGTIRYNLKKAVSLGLNPITALQMATINPARIYRLHHLGAVAPGYQADLVVLENLTDFQVREVYTSGRKASYFPQSSPEESPAYERITHSVHPAPLLPEAFALPPGEELPVINIIPGQVSTHLTWVRRALVPELIRKGVLRKIVVVERHHATGHVGVGLLCGYGLSHGAIATTVAHDSHNLIAVGDTDADLFAAIAELERVQGGYTIVRDGSVLATLPLTIAGLMSEAPSETFLPALDGMLEEAKKAGVSEGIDPYITLSFMALPVIPEVRITDMGVFDVRKFAFI